VAIIDFRNILFQTEKHPLIWWQDAHPFLEWIYNGTFRKMSGVYRSGMSPSAYAPLDERLLTIRIVLLFSDDLSLEITGIAAKASDLRK
jgi:hypothetical protein